MSLEAVSKDYNTLAGKFPEIFRKTPAEQREYLSNVNQVVKKAVDLMQSSYSDASPALKKEMFTLLGNIVKDGYYTYDSGLGKPIADLAKLVF